MALTGCTSAHVKHDIVSITQKQVFQLKVIPLSPLYHNGIRVKGLARFVKGFCEIKIDPEYYSHSCLGHKLRHCLEGYWHDERPVDC